MTLATIATTHAQTLTAQDIKAMRTCDDIVYRFNRADNVSQLECIKRADKHSPWEQTHVVNVNTSDVCYAGTYGSDIYSVQVARAFHMQSRYDWDENETNTFLSLLRPGDTITARLTANNNNGSLNRAGLFMDELRLCIRRPNAKKGLVFLIAVSVCPDNRARMCKVERKHD